MRRGISARDGALDGAPNERRMKGGIPETAPRHSDGWAIFFRNVRRTRYSDAVRAKGICTSFQPSGHHAVIAPFSRQRRSRRSG